MLFDFCIILESKYISSIYIINIYKFLPFSVGFSNKGVTGHIISSLKNYMMILLYEWKFMYSKYAVYQL
ncbi:hypothetical protein V1477_009463 [Vespula maculifrons]|uniref:Uncharacterized protein n=1 Tax=Vespula maculifrons TaxID=7453 RepID=A0ABD2C9U1_VESMC